MFYIEEITWDIVGFFGLVCAEKYFPKDQNYFLTSNCTKFCNLKDGNKANN